MAPDPKRFVRVEYTDGDQDGTVYGTSRSPETDQARLAEVLRFLEQAHPGCLIEEVAVVRMNGDTPDEDEVIEVLDPGASASRVSEATDIDETTPTCPK